MSSDDEMETCLSNPVYDAVEDSKLLHCEDGLQSKERAQGRRVPETRER